MSTGRLGITLANRFAAEGNEVHCLKGEGATHPEPLRVASAATFTTNDDLARQLELRGRALSYDAVLHAAALCDFRIARVRDAQGASITSAKFATRDGRLELELEPATKILPRLRFWFPGARIIGWKYELAGRRNDAFGKAWRQLSENRTDACVLNGAAYGAGFAVCYPDGRHVACQDASHLGDELSDWFSAPPCADLEAQEQCSPQLQPA